MLVRFFVSRTRRTKIERGVFVLWKYNTVLYGLRMGWVLLGFVGSKRGGVGGGSV